MTPFTNKFTVTANETKNEIRVFFMQDIPDINPKSGEVLPDPITEEVGSIVMTGETAIMLAGMLMHAATNIDTVDNNEVENDE